MDSFMSTLFVMGLGSPIDYNGFDIVGQLPTEIGSMILRYLDGDSILQAAAVSKRWNSLCRGDLKLRQKGRRHLRKMKNRKKEQILGGIKKLAFVPVNEVTAFSSKNMRNVNHNNRMNGSHDESAMIILHPKENILQRISHSMNISPMKIKKSKPLSKIQKKRLLRH